MRNMYFLSLNKDANALDQWDCGIVLDILSPYFDVHNVNGLPKADRAVVVIPARHHKGLEAAVDKELKKIERVILFLLGDEEADFDIDKITHGNIEIWVQNPHMDKHDKYNKIGTGYPKHMKDNLPPIALKACDLFFSGQITHQRREELWRVLSAMVDQGSKFNINATEGFTQGLDHKTYYEAMTQAKIAPAPSGAVIPDSFRLFEALETMSVVIADQKTPDGKVHQYWDWLFGESVPFDCVDDWDRLFVLVPEILNDYHAKMHRQTAWWMLWKRNFKNKVLEQYNA